MKKWYQSRTIWGAVVTLASFIIMSVSGVDISSDTQKTIIDNIIDIVTAVSALVGTVLTITGRIRASSIIE